MGFSEINNRAVKLSKEMRDMLSRDNLSEEEQERAARVRTELAELCPPDRYSWVNGLPEIDLWEGLIEVEAQRKKMKTESIQSRKEQILHALLGKLDAAGKIAVAGFESAKGEVSRLQESSIKYEARKSELEKQLQGAKMEARQGFESGKAIGNLSKKTIELKYELDVVSETIESIEDEQLPAAKQAMKDSQRELERVVGSVLDEYRIELQREFDDYVEKLEVVLEAWSITGYSLMPFIKTNSVIEIPPLRFSSSALNRQYYPR